MIQKLYDLLFKVTTKLEELDETTLADEVKQYICDDLVPLRDRILRLEHKAFMLQAEKDCANGNWV